MLVDAFSPNSFTSELFRNYLYVVATSKCQVNSNVKVSGRELLVMG
jgi:hypothetical protein